QRANGRPARAPGEDVRGARPRGRRATARGARRQPGGDAMNIVPQPHFLPVDWWALGAIIALTLGAILLLLLEFIPPRPNGDRGPLLSILALAVAGYAAYHVRADKRSLFEGMFVHDGLTVFFTLLFCAVGIVSVLFAWDYNKRTRIGQPEFYALL